jgi:hypothetical protein
MRNVRVIYFKGCPRAEVAMRAVESAGIIGAEYVVQDELSADDPLLRFSSPSILAGDEVIYGGFHDGSGACSSEPISIERIVNLLLGTLA